MGPGLDSELPHSEMSFTLVLLLPTATTVATRTNPSPSIGPHVCASLVHGESGLCLPALPRRAFPRPQLLSHSCSLPPPPPSRSYSDAGPFLSYIGFCHKHSSLTSSESVAGSYGLVRLGNPPFLCPSLDSKACDLKLTGGQPGKGWKEVAQAFSEDLWLLQRGE